MFTGLVEAVGAVQELRPISASSSPGTSGQPPGEVPGVRLTLRHELGPLELGESIAVDGACLTVVAFGENTFSVEVSSETLERTALGQLEPGARVNLERSLRMGDRLGGHLVSGHVDGLARVVALDPEGEMMRVRFAAPPHLARFLAEKGSVTVSGVSLTVNSAEGAEFSLLLIPHTRAVTNLGELAPEKLVNLEVDMIARYVESLLSASSLER